MPPSAKPRMKPPSAAPAAKEIVAGRERMFSCLRVRPPLNDEEDGADNAALHLDGGAGLCWALSERGESDAQQFSFDELLESHHQQLACFDAVGAPALKAAMAGGTGVVICYGANGAGKRHSMGIERVGSEAGVQARVLSTLFSGRASGSGTHRGAPMPAPGQHAEARDADAPTLGVEVAYLVLDREQQVHDLFAGPGPCWSRDFGGGSEADEPADDGSVLPKGTVWETADSAAEVLRLLARGDNARPHGCEVRTGPALCNHHTIVAFRLRPDATGGGGGGGGGGEHDALSRQLLWSLQSSGSKVGALLLVTLADADAVLADGAQSFRAGFPSLHASVEALGGGVESLARGGRVVGAPETPLLTLLAPALSGGGSGGDRSLGGGGGGGGSFLGMLLCVHPHRQKLQPLTLHVLQLGHRAGGGAGAPRGRPQQKQRSGGGVGVGGVGGVGVGVDYMALASQLLMQRDAKQAALHTMETDVLKQLRPQLEAVVRDEAELVSLATRVQQAEFEARAYQRKEAPLQAQHQQQRAAHDRRMATIRAEREAASGDMRTAFAHSKGGAELQAMQNKHAEDVDVLSARLRALQSEVELVEAEVARHDEASASARVLLPAVGRDLGALALKLCEQGRTQDAAETFCAALGVLEGAFGSGAGAQPELHAFKVDVRKAVGEAAEAAQATAREGSVRGGSIFEGITSFRKSTAQL